MGRMWEVIEVIFKHKVCHLLFTLAILDIGRWISLRKKSVL